MTWDDAQAIALKLPGAEPGSYHGYPAVRVKGRFLMRRGDDPDTLEFKGLDAAERDLLLSTRPDVYVLPERGAAMLFARLAALDAATLDDILERRWRAIAPKALR
jgi:hypothetical protein